MTNKKSMLLTLVHTETVPGATVFCPSSLIDRSNFEELDGGSVTFFKDGYCTNQLESAMAFTHISNVDFNRQFLVVCRNFAAYRKNLGSFVKQLSREKGDYIFNEDMCCFRVGLPDEMDMDTICIDYPSWSSTCEFLQKKLVK